MFKPEIKIEERKNLADIAHKNFVDRMWSKFGLISHPGYCLVQIMPLISLEGFSYKPQESIFLNDILSTQSEIRNETYHGSAHFLDPFIRELHKRGVEPSSGDVLLHETLANLATMVYLDLSEGNEVAKALPSYNGKPTYSSLLALDIFEENKDLLSELAYMSMRKAKKIILPHLKRRLDIAKNPYDQK